jgi:hypothetical protein
VSTLTERVARAMCAVDCINLSCRAHGCLCPTLRQAEARAAAREVLAAMREPSEAIRRPFLAWKLFGTPKLERAWAAAVDIRASEHGL